jgi:hypothetical protein
MHVNEALRIVESLVDALDWNLESNTIIDGVIEHFGAGQVMEQIDTEVIREYLGEHTTPEEIFTQEDLEAWAKEQIGSYAWDQAMEGLLDEDY